MTTLLYKRDDSNLLLYSRCKHANKNRQMVYFLIRPHMSERVKLFNVSLQKDLFRIVKEV